MINNKRGISDVIATVLIILVTIIAAGALGAFLIPWAQEQMGGATDCLDIRGKISFVQDNSCYFIGEDGVGNYTQIRIKFGEVNITEMNFYVPIDNGVRAILIKEGTKGATILPPPMNISVLKKGVYEDTLSLPPIGGERTYRINEAILKSIKVAAVVNGKTCDMVETDLDRCKSV
jgi:flagellin-like protein